MDEKKEIEKKEIRIGSISTYFSKIGVAAIRLTSDDLKVGDTIHIKGHTTNFEQIVESIQIEKKPVQSAQKGDEIGIKVKDRVREGDIVFKVTKD